MVSSSLMQQARNSFVNSSFCLSYIFLGFIFMPQISKNLVELDYDMLLQFISFFAAYDYCLMIFIILHYCLQVFIKFLCTNLWLNRNMTHHFLIFFHRGTQQVWVLKIPSLSSVCKPWSNRHSFVMVAIIKSITFLQYWHTSSTFFEMIILKIILM